MSTFAKNIAPFVCAELHKSKQAQQLGDYEAAFAHLENAHVLGQASTYWHVRVHLHMMLWGIRRKDVKEIFGQVIRVIGAAALTAMRGVPEGNTGGSYVSAEKTMPIKPEHAEVIASAKKNV